MQFRTILFPYKKSRREKRTSVDKVCNTLYSYFLTVFLSVPFHKLPCFNTDFATKEGLDQHFATVHQQLEHFPNNENNMKFIQEDENKENIPNTSTNFNNFDDFNSQIPSVQTPHESVHNQKMPFVSNICNGGFTDEKSVFKHIDNVHQEERKLRCTICNQAEFLTGKDKCQLISELLFDVLDSPENQRKNLMNF